MFQLTSLRGTLLLRNKKNIIIFQDTKSHEDICLGFLVLILTEADNAQKHYR